jgi:hypothetical protein
MNIRKIVLGGLVATAALAGPAALASSAYADDTLVPTLVPMPQFAIQTDTIPTAPCTPVQAVPAWTETQYKYVPATNGTGPTYWAKDKPTPTTQTIDVNGVKYVNANSVRKIEHPAVAGVTCPQPQTGEPYVIVPFTPHVKTYLMGVQGHPETDAITADVKVTPTMSGGQFWIRYEYEDGYAPANPGIWHVDFSAGVVQ